MVGRWSAAAAAYSCLTVALYVAEPSQVELTVQDHVRVDRVSDTGAERYGELVPPGTTAVYLTVGTYVFRTAQDALVRLPDATAVQVVAVSGDTKTGWPDPPLGNHMLTDAGDAPPDRVPTLTVLG